MSVRNAKNVVSQVKRLQDMMTGTTNPSAEEWSPVPSDIGQLVREAAAFLQPLSPKIRMTVRVAPDLPETSADPDQVQQLIINLYDNSAEAFEEAAEGAGSIDISVLLSPGDSSIVIIYSDDGPGIPDEAGPRIFDGGFTTKDKAEGMGLTECRLVARKHGGEIVYKAGQEAGVLFSIRLPVIESPDE